jgi:TonB family protein
MVDRSVSSPAAPDLVERRTPWQASTSEVTRLTAIPDSGQIVAKLRANIRSGRLSSDLMLQQIAEAARALARANGVAIAMRQNDSVLCTARAGHMAPDLGSELSSNSGISGQCFRTGAALRCDDTATDPRVDADACRRLGLRSLAVVPVGKLPAVSGVLEVFSANPDAFSDGDVRLLIELADLVMAAQYTRTMQGQNELLDDAHRQRASTALVAPAYREPPAGKKPWGRKVIAGAIANIKSAFLNANQKLAGVTWNWSKIAPILAAVVILALVSWLGFRGKATPPNSAAAGPQTESLPPAVADEAAPVLAEPAHSPAKPPPSAKASPHRDVATARRTGKSESAIARTLKPEAPSDSNAGATPSANIGSPIPEKPAEEEPAAPALPAVSAGNDTELSGVLNPPNIQVQPAIKLSQGVSGGTIERHVDPIYPSEARWLNVQGQVVLEALITEKGNVRNLKVVEGNSLLARAAMNAVAQWHYRPYRLNGQPIAMTTQITLIFKLR